MTCSFEAMPRLAATTIGDFALQTCCTQVERRRSEKSSSGEAACPSGINDRVSAAQDYGGKLATSFFAVGQFIHVFNINQFGHW